MSGLEITGVVVLFVLAIVHVIIGFAGKGNYALLAVVAVVMAVPSYLFEGFGFAFCVLAITFILYFGLDPDN